MVTITLGHLPAHLSALVPMVEIAYCLSIVAHSIVYDVQMRMFLVLMQHGHVLRVLDAHLFHVFPCMFRHLLNGKLIPVDRKSTTSELQSRENLVCRLLLEKKKNNDRCTES